MKTLLLALAFTIALAAPLAATDLTATTTIKTADWPEVRDTIAAWRATQLKPDGVTPKYPTLASLGESILRKSIREIVRIQCAADPSICPTSVKTEMTAEKSGATGVNTALDTIFVNPQP